MPRKKKNEITTEPVETVEGSVEGLTYSQAEVITREEARKKYHVSIDWSGFGKNQMSEAVGLVFLNRTRRKSVKEAEFSCGAELDGAIDEYWCLMFDLAEHGHGNVPDVESLADFLGVSRGTLLRWKNGEDNLEFVDPLNVAFNEIAEVKKQLAATGRVNGLVYLNDLQNNHGYLNNQKTNDLNVNVRLKHEPPSREQLIEMTKLLP